MHARRYTVPTLSMGSDFSRYPYGLDKADGRTSAPFFRQQLVERLGQGELIVDVSGVTGLINSYIREAFGGLVSKEGFSAAQLHALMRVRCDDDQSLVEEIWRAIDKADSIAAPMAPAIEVHA